MKKFIAALLTVVLLMSLTAGCGSTGSKEEAAGTADTNTDASQSSSADTSSGSEEAEAPEVHVFNIYSIGEDFKKGTVLATKGTRVDIGIIGTASSLGFNEIKVYKRPIAGILSTGDEIVDPEEEMPYGKIRNSNRYTIAAALNQLGFDTPHNFLLQYEQWHPPHFRWNR